jgi:protein-tyrosine phosphatase
MAYDDGIRSVIATPHYNNSCRSSRTLIEERAGELAGRLRREGCDLRLLTGNECEPDEYLLRDLVEGRCLTLAGSRYVLIEISAFMPHTMTRRMLADLQDRDYIPIIAHCERLVMTKRDMDRIDDLTLSGCLMQVNAETVLRKEKGWFSEWVFRKIEDGTVAFIASDAHGLTRRKPLLREAYDKVTRLLGARAADNVFHHNAARILASAAAKPLDTGIK